MKTLIKFEKSIKEHGEVVLYTGMLCSGIANMVAWLHSWPFWLKCVAASLLVVLTLGVIYRRRHPDAKKLDGATPPPDVPAVGIERVARCHTAIIDCCRAEVGDAPMPSEVTLGMGGRTLALREFWDAAFLEQVGTQTFGGDLKIVHDKQGRLSCVRLENAWKHVPKSEGVAS